MLSKGVTRVTMRESAKFFVASVALFAVVSAFGIYWMVTP
jgi:hypothetical protein